MGVGPDKPPAKGAVDLAAQSLNEKNAASPAPAGMVARGSTQPTILYILSTNYAGSHFLSLLLGSHCKAAHVGELNHLRKNRDRGDCHACGGLEQCAILGGIGPDRMDCLYDVLYSRLPDTLVLIDNSKRIPWAERFVREDRFRRKYVHLIRDPRALARRWTLYYTSMPGRIKQRWQSMRAFPRSAPRLALASQMVIYVYRWLAENQRITRFIQGYRLDARLVTYEELAMNPSGPLRAVMEWLDLEYEPDQLAYWTKWHHGTQKQEYEWIKEKKAQHIDDRWKTFWTPREVERIRANQDVQTYLRELGLTMTDEGLAGATGSSARCPGCWSDEVR
jgi:hypothetical protein